MACWCVGSFGLRTFFYVASAETGFSSFGVCRSHSSIVADDLRCMFANLFLPAGTGLDLLRLVLLKEGGVKLDKVGALTLLDRGVTLASLLTLASVSLVVLMSVSKISFDVGVLLMLFLAVPVCVVCAAAFFFRSRGGVFASERGRCGAIAWLNRFAGYLGLVMKRGGDLGAAFGGCRVESALHFVSFGMHSVGHWWSQLGVDHIFVFTICSSSQHNSSFSWKCGVDGSDGS